MIKRILLALSGVGVVFALVATDATAQKSGPELGLQLAAIDFSSSGGVSTNTFAIGGGSASIAFYLNEKLAIEPSLGFAHISSGGNSLNSTNLQVAVPYYLKAGWGKAGGLFIAPHIGIMSLSSGGSSVSQNHFGADVGTKFKLANQVFWRLQGGLDFGLSNDNFDSSTTFGGAFGVSVYLK